MAALLNILPGFFAIPPTDRDESRFAQATKQMLESGDFIDIRFQETTRYKKPVGIYWLQAGVVKAAQALGVRDALTTIWLYRIPSLLGAVGAVLLTYWAALAFLSRRAALLAGLMMATCILLSVEGRIAKTDACLLLTAVAAMGAMARAYLPEQRAQLEGTASWTVPAIFWTALAASVLLKGPVIPLIVFLTVAALAIADRSARWLLALRPLVGVALVRAAGAALVRGDHACAPATASSRSRSGEDLLSKLFQGQESHGAPPGYYFLLFWVTFWPAATLAGVAAPCGLVVASRARRAIPAGLDRADLDPVRAGRHQAAALRAAALSGDRDPDRRRRRCARAAVAEPWLERGTIWWFILPVRLGLLGLGVLIFDRAAIRIPGLAADRRGDGDGLPRLAALQQRRRRACADARVRGCAADGDRDLRADRPGAACGCSRA